MSFSPDVLPPSEIPFLARLCITGDLEHINVNSTFHAKLDAYFQKGHQTPELWPVLLAAVEYARPKIITLLLSQGLAIHQMHVLQAVRTKSKEVLQALLDSGWDINQPLDTFYPPVLA